MKRVDRWLAHMWCKDGAERLIPLSMIIGADVVPEEVEKMDKKNNERFYRLSLTGIFLGVSWETYMEKRWTNEFAKQEFMVDDNSCETRVWTHRFGLLRIPGNHVDKIMTWRPDLHFFSVREKTMVLPERPRYVMMSDGEKPDDCIVRLDPFGDLKFENVKDRNSLLSDILKMCSV